MIPNFRPAVMPPRLPMPPPLKRPRPDIGPCPPGPPTMALKRTLVPLAGSNYLYCLPLAGNVNNVKIKKIKLFVFMLLVHVGIMLFCGEI